ncbi:MAG TPA: hypothetical protein VG347_02800, partial [Verrucomicrobiae bacterium]|nr:hypothetical protein [Verrucomicrobiae bacterium]
MNEKPKSIWKRSFTGRVAWITWLAIAVFAVMLGTFITALANFSRPLNDLALEVGILAGAFLVVCLIL